MYHVIINPASRTGKSIKLWNKVMKPYLDTHQVSYDYFFTTREFDADSIVRKLLSEALEFPIHVLVLGGDGTMNTLLQGIDDFSKVLVSYLPTGSSNDFARDIGISKDFKTNLSHILNDPTRLESDIGLCTYTIDGEMRTRRFNCGCGLGFDAAVCEKVDVSPLKNVLNKIGLGKLTYGGIAIAEIFGNKSNACEIYLDDAPVIKHSKFLFIVGMVHRYEGGGLMFCPHADFKDGLLDVCAVHEASALAYISALPAAKKGQHIRRKFVSEHRCKSLRIKIGEPRCLHTDGEVLGHVAEVEMHCLKERLQLVI